MGRLDQLIEHRDGVTVLQVMRKVMVIKRDVIVTHLVERRPRKVIAEQRRVALDEGVQLFLFD